MPSALLDLQPLERSAALLGSVCGPIHCHGRLRLQRCPNGARKTLMRLPPDKATESCSLHSEGGGLETTEVRWQLGMSGG